MANNTIASQKARQKYFPPRMHQITQGIAHACTHMPFYAIIILHKLKCGRWSGVLLFVTHESFGGLSYNIAPMRTTIAPMMLHRCEFLQSQHTVDCKRVV